MKLNFKSKSKKLEALTPKVVHHQGLKRQNLIFIIIVVIIITGLGFLTIKSISFLVKGINIILKVERQFSGTTSNFDFSSFEKIKEKLPELTPPELFSPSLTSTPSATSENLLEVTPYLPESPLISPTSSPTSSPAF